MERGEVSALVSPSRRRSKLRAQRGGGETGFDDEASRREEIVVEELEEEALLRALDEQLQQRIDRLTDVDLVLGAKQINYLAFRLHEALEPKPDTETNVIQAWTIQPQAQLKIKMSSHIQVLKLSTILREVRRLRIHQQSQLRSPIEIEIFPSLRALEIVHTDVVALRNVHFFARQLRQFRLEHTPLGSLSQLLSPLDASSPTTWTRLQSLRVNCCSLPSVDASINQLSAVEVVDLAWNEIVGFNEPLQCTTLLWLDLCRNKLTTFPPLANLHTLKVLDLSVNHIQSLKGVETLTALIDLDVSNNALHQIGELELLAGLKELRRLMIRENPIARRPDYRREVLFYLGEQVELDDADWTQVELLSMKHSRRLRRREETPLSSSSNTATTWASAPFAASPAWDTATATMVYPSLAPQAAGLLAQPADIAPPPRLYSPRRRIVQQLQASGRSKSTRILKTSGLLDRSSLEGTTTDATDDPEDAALPSEPSVETVNDFFRLRSTSAAVNPVKHKDVHVGVPVDHSIEYDSDSEDSSSEKGRNRSRKYTESDFMRDFEEEETLLQEGAVDAFETRARRQSSHKSTRHQAKAESSVNVRVLLSAEDAAVFDLAFGIDGLVATVDVKANEILETLLVPERESSIAFSRRLPDVVAIGVSTHSTRGKIMVLKLRKSDHAVGGVTYQIETIPTLVRLLAPLLGHLYAAVAAHQLPTAFVCSNCGGVSHLTSEYIEASRPKSAAGDALVLQACLLCTSLNIRELSSDRLLAMYAAEGMASLVKRIKPSSERHAQMEVGFIVEEQELNEQEELDIHHCVMISANGIREAVNAPVATA